jgi:hypothetical protein
VDWVTWSTGDLTVDADSFLLVFKSADGTVKAKVLGNLVRASRVAPDDDRTLAITTSDSLHKLWRFTFGSSTQGSDFVALAKVAEEKAAAALRSRSESQSGASSREAGTQLEADIRQKLSSRLPLVYGGAELYGPDPGGDGAGSEVLLGSGAFVLVDPPEEEEGRIGSYELLFYCEDEGVRAPAKQIVIGRKMALRRSSCEADDAMAASFELPGSPGVPTHTLAFDSANVGANFARDYRVRQRLMEMAVKNVKGARATSDLRGELEDLKNQGLAQQVARKLRLLVLVFFIACSVRLAMLYSEGPGRPPAAYAEVLMHDILSIGQTSREAAASIAKQACKLTVSALDTDDLKLCMAEGATDEQMTRCIRQLARV